MDNIRQPNCQDVIPSRASEARPKEEPEKSSLMEDAQISLWNSLESDTESLVQERRYQMELKSRIQQANEIVNANSEGYVDESSGEEEDDLEELVGEDNYIYDSLDVAESQQGQIKTVPHDTKVGEILQKKRQDKFGYRPAEDEYAGLRYDPNWRTNLKEDKLFEEGNQLLLEEEGPNVYADPSDESPWKSRDHSGNGEQKNLSDHRQARSMGLAVYMAPDRLSEYKSKRLPAPHYTPPQRNMAVGAETTLSEQQRPQKGLHRTEDASSRRPNGVPAAGNRMHSGETQVVSQEQEESYEEMNQRYAKEYQVFYEQESDRTENSTDNSHDSAYSNPNQSRRLPNIRQTKPRKDIVERNKMTLGVRRKQASYLSAHGQKGLKEEQKSQQQGSDAVEETTEHQYLNPELRWQQKTQRLKVHREKKKGKREGDHPCPGPPGGDLRERGNPSVPRDGHGPRQRRGQAEVLVIDEADHGDSPLSPTPPTSLWPQGLSPHTMNPPTFNLNINLSASGDGVPGFLGQEHQHASLNLSPPRGPSLRSRPAISYHNPMSGHYDPAQVVYYGPRYPHSAPQAVLPTSWFPAQKIQGTLPQGSKRGPRDVPPLWDHDSHSLQGMDSDRSWLGPATWQPAGDWSLYLSPGEQRIELRPPHRLPAQSTGSYPLLPPIGEAVASDSELSGQNARHNINGMQRSISEGYLAQLEKQRQLKEKTAYKAYTLKDYKALKKDVKLGGLGPDYKVTPITAEKIRRRQQYSDKVRENNKNISRIPFLPTRNPCPAGGDTTENMVPRMKALEYARSIPKPKPPAEPKSSERDGPRDFLQERAQYLEHLDLTQLARLEMLQKRHEEEKQVVAHFKALRAV
ncbi:jhy protein homolog isoform X1 [Conger conger]|uniref:jhy protein homolog isoform X1 n=1 Tax=Conger conger TaxID=82655 RepID=UPI002A5AEF03|nr:jhy protein homolog isoform X1 [Conger conger]XP_061105864.1 jhy protein homolog isoform X1 [Conger conger]